MNNKNNIEKIKTHDIKFYCWVALVGVMRTLTGNYLIAFLGFPIEQPLEITKTIWQAEPQHRNELKVVKSIYERFGVLGFYRGTVANYLRTTIKTTYRYPLLIFFQGIFDHLFPGMEKDAKKLAFVKALSGFCVANVDSVIVCPIERIKVFFMTRNEFKGGYYKYLKYHSRSLVRTLFRGIRIHMLRQNVSWFVWLQSDACAKMYIRRKYNIDPYKERVPFKSVLPVALMTSLLNVLTVMPFDMIKTNIQKEKPIKFRDLLSMYGSRKNLKYFFVAWRVRLLQYFIQNVFTMNMLEIMETKYRQIKHNKY